MSSPPHGERPCDGDGLQDVRGEVGLAGVELAPFAGAHDLASVSERGGPVEAMAERIAHEGAGRGVVATYARVYIPEKLAPLGDGHASMQDAGGGAFVQLAVDESERLSHPGDAPSLGPVRGEFPSVHPGDILVAPVRLAGGWSTSIALASSASYPSSRESTYASFEGSSSMGTAPVGLEGAPEGSSQFEGCGSRLTDGWAMSRAKTFGGDGDPP
jgi:hypothetical protein